MCGSGRVRTLFVRTVFAAMKRAVRALRKRTHPTTIAPPGLSDAKRGAIRARLGRSVGQPDHILANPIISHKAERRPGSGEIWLAMTKHDGV